MKNLEKALEEGLRQPTNIAQRMRWARTFQWLCRLTSSFSILILVVLLYTVFSRGFPYISWNFLTRPPHPKPDQAGIWPALLGTFWTCAACGLLSLPIGIGTAIFLEELRPRNRWVKGLHSLVQLNIANLAGVPSVVYGIVGMAAFVNMFGMMDRMREESHAAGPLFEFGVSYYDQFLTLNDSILLCPVSHAAAPETTPSDGLACVDTRGNRVTMKVVAKGSPSPKDEGEKSIAVRWNETPGRISKQAWYHFAIPFGRSVLAGGLTLMLVILPVVILSSQEAFRAVPPSLRDAALGMGATPWQAVWNITLPAAVPGIMTGSILAMSRAIGEAAPIMMISGIVFITRGPSNLMSPFTVLSLQIYDWAGRHEIGFHHISAAAIIILLVLLLVFNSLAIFIRQRFSQPLS